MNRLRARVPWWALALVLLGTQGACAAQCAEPAKQPVQAAATVLHGCGRGQHTVTITSQHTSMEKTPKCNVKHTSLDVVAGDRYKEPKTVDPYSNSFYFDIRGPYTVYATDCDQDFVYTDWPECGGEKMYPVSVPREHDPCTCKCLCKDAAHACDINNCTDCDIGCKVEDPTK